MKDYTYYSEIDCIINDLNDWWNNHMTLDDYSSKDDYIADLNSIIDNSNEDIINSVIGYFIDDCNHTEYDINKYMDELLSWIHDRAEEDLDYINC